MSCCRRSSCCIRLCCSNCCLSRQSSAGICTVLHSDEDDERDTLAILDTRNVYGALDNLAAVSSLAIGVDSNDSASVRQALPWKMGEGKMLTIEGDIPSDSYRWCVNLMGINTDTIALHCSIRHDRRHFIRNSMQSGLWAHEELSCSGGMPFTAGQRFILHVLCAKSAYLLAVNGVLVVRFRHRIPAICVGVVTIAGDVCVTNVSFSENVTHFPPSCAAKSLSPAQSSSPLRCYSVTENLRFPYVLPAVVETAGEIVVDGRVKLLPYSFCVNLQTSALALPEASLLLHFNPRFQMGRDRNVIVLNSRSCGYGEEIRCRRFPFRAGQLFSLRFSCDARGWRIAINDVYLLTFDHRLTSRLLYAVDVSGDVTVTRIQFRPRGRDLIDL